jgi:large subunit ribosomal protein L15
MFAPDAEVTPEELLKARLIKSVRKPVKILGDGEIDRPLVVRANKFSTTAEKKIVAAGGRVEGI